MSNETQYNREGPHAGCFQIVYVIHYRTDADDFWHTGDCFTPYSSNADKMARDLRKSLKAKGVSYEVVIAEYALQKLRT